MGVAGESICDWGLYKLWTRTISPGRPSSPLRQLRQQEDIVRAVSFALASRDSRPSGCAATAVATCDAGVCIPSHVCQRHLAFEVRPSRLILEQQRLREQHFCVYDNIHDDIKQCFAQCMLDLPDRLPTSSSNVNCKRTRLLVGVESAHSVSGMWSP